MRAEIIEDLQQFGCVRVRRAQLFLFLERVGAN